MRAVLADDHVLFLEAMAVVLGRHGHTVVALAATPEDALVAVAEHAPDVLLLDLHFGSGDCLPVLGRLRREHPGTRVLVLTTDRGPDVVAAVLAAGAAGYVRKDQHADGVVRALERVRAGETVADADIAQASGFRAGERVLRYLTVRERQVLRRIVEGESTKQIARSLDIAHSTARTHAQNVLVKLGAHSRLEAAAIVADAGLLDRIADDG